MAQAQAMLIGRLMLSFGEAESKLITKALALSAEMAWGNDLDYSCELR